MKKVICIVLLSWLPAFMLAANAMAMQMAFVSISPTQSTSVHHGCHEAHDDAAPAQPSVHQCVVCSMCVLSHAVALSTPALSTYPDVQHSQPLFYGLSFTSLTIPPAIKPPILS